MSAFELKFAPIAATVAGDTTVVAADATRRIRVLHYLLKASGSQVSLRWKADGAFISGVLAMNVREAVQTPFVDPNDGWLLETGINQPLILNLSGATTVGGHLVYYLED